MSRRAALLAASVAALLAGPRACRGCALRRAAADRGRRRRGGRRVAVLVGCRDVRVVRVDSGGVHRLHRPAVPCAAAAARRGGPLAFDGRRVALRIARSGPVRETVVAAAPLYPPTRLSIVDRVAAGGGTAARLDGPRGGAGLLAWVRPSPAGAEVRAVGTRTPLVIGAVPPGAALLDARGRRLVVRAGGRVLVLDRTGATRADVPAAGVVDAAIPAAGVVDAAVLGSRVLLLRAGRIDRIEPDGSPRTGVPRLRASAGRATTFAASATVAVYAVGGVVHAVRLADGAHARIARVPRGAVAGSGLAGADIGAAGVVYAVNRCRAPGACRGELHRLPNGRLAALLGG